MVAADERSRSRGVDLRQVSLNLLLDTHIFIWAVSLPERLSTRAELLLSDGRNRLHLSTSSIWEISLKHSLGKENFIFPEEAVVAGIEHLGCQIVNVNARHAFALFRLPAIHRDPFDRILLAQAWTDNLLLVTADRRLSEYPEVQTVW